ncbi:MAG: thiamine phosphate synthase [Nitrospirae bacterium]|jgi:thiamine-phosphate pyrophosphorylase|nr:thiamine phosphate synthase [Nitrospirota bacterium]
MYLAGICFITDQNICRLPLKEMTRIVLDYGIRWIQYRDKKNTRRLIYENAIEMKKITSEYDATLIINDHTDIALASESDGVHLGQDDLPLKEVRKISGQNFIIGISTHSLEQALDAQNMGADYIGFGPIFHTNTKDAGKPKGIKALKEIKKMVNIPVIAIGGINSENLSSVLNTGVDGIAVSSGILKGDIKTNIKYFLDSIGRV